MTNVLGYSFAIQSSMLSGKYPDENLHWMPYYYSPSNSPLIFKTMARFGHALQLDRIPFLRYPLERFGRNFFSRRGVQANNIPLSIIDKISLYPYFYMNELPFFSELQRLLYKENESSLIYFGPPNVKGDEVYYSLYNHLKKTSFERNNEFLIVYEDRLDSIGHGFGPSSKEYCQFANYLDMVLKKLYWKIKDKFKENVVFFIFSDHGQSQFTGSLDIVSSLAHKDLIFAKHYICFIDATIALFWLRDEHAQDRLENALRSLERGTVIDEKLKERYHLIFREKRMYGDLIYVLEPGWTFFPNFFSCFGVMKGLHGYLPENHVQNALLISDENLSFKVSHVKDTRELIIKLVCNAY
ncbi:MAG: alkaline phosphatase family protein [Nitrososphaeria archaeon]